LERGKLTGTVTNRSLMKLENVAIVFSGGAAILSDLEPAQSKEVELDVTTSPFFGYALSEAIFGTTFPRDSATARTISTRRSVLDQLFPGGSQGAADAPLLLAWSKGPVLAVELPGDEPNRVGDGLYMVPLAMAISSDQIFADQMLRRDIVDSSAATAWADASSMYLSRGTMTVEVHPARFDGAFAATALEIALTQGETRVLRGTGEFVEPLPAEQQPPQDDPLSDLEPSPTPETTCPPGVECPAPAPTAAPADGKGEAEPGRPPVDPGAVGLDPMPDYQLFDRTSGLWVQFPHPSMTQSYRISNPERYVDESGRVQFRFVNSNDPGQFGEDQKYFNLLVRLEGTIE
ncbi:MAG TPA: hypothetical protein VMZ33_02995, partial [Candidatus Limnocylindrales bacterium]|nr:hypothetical protein [Candidatus Limnocylindrales bacterium]